MHRIYYNPKVYTPTKHIDRVREIKPDDTFYELEKKHAYESEEAVMQENFEGPVTYWEEGKLMHGDLYPEWMYEICPDVATVQWGINWGDIIALSKGLVLEKYYEMFSNRDEDAERMVQYDEKLGVYSLHVHYDGRV